MRSKTFVVMCGIAAAALCAGCHGSQAADEATDRPAPVVMTQPAEKPTPVKAVQVRKTAASARKMSVADATPATAAAGDSRTEGKQDVWTTATISGCVEREGDMFRLTDTTGDDAPKSRSWKSGFIKKSSATIDIVEGALRLKLADHVGRRVTMSGLLTDRHMQARTVRVIAASCE